VAPANYDKVGGLRGLIEDAAERALRGLSPDEDVALLPGPPTKHRIDLGASTFVPALAQINDQGATIRRSATWNSFTDEQQELLLRFAQWRLVVRKGEADGGTVEVAHEALFREWKRLQGWLEPERARLEALRSLQVDALTWDRNGRDAAFLNHRDKRLAEAMTLAGIEGYAKRLGALEFDYLEACQAAERSERRRRRRVQASISVLIMAVVAALAGWLNERELRLGYYVFSNVRGHLLPAEVERAMRAGDSFKECTDCPEMLVIPAGAFTMGSPDDEKSRRNDEGPQHHVAFRNHFAVAKFELKFDEWDKCVAVGGCNDYKPSDNGWGRGRRPVINVSWEDAKSYVAWLSRITGKNYRLLTEAEYEYATRAGTQTAYPWGNDIGKGNANCLGCGSKWEGLTAPVGSFFANGFGLYDMVGNVWGWAEDCWHDNYNGAPGDGSAWTSGDCSRRVARGGSWFSLPADVRSASRIGGIINNRDLHLGFRVGRTLSAE
jgi:formylglycine-generating enzyme required for sulfatase activity